jgi:hypothetical protein
MWYSSLPNLLVVAFCRQPRILARFCLLVGVAIARCIYVAIEQPRSSVMPKMKFFRVFEKQLQGLLHWNFCNLRGSQLFLTTHVVVWFSCHLYYMPLPCRNHSLQIPAPAESHGMLWSEHGQAHEGLWNNAISSAVTTVRSIQASRIGKPVWHSAKWTGLNLFIAFLALVTMSKS